MVTYVKVEDPGVKDGKCHKNSLGVQYPGFIREDMDLMCSIIDKEWCYK